MKPAAPVRRVQAPAGLGTGMTVELG